MTTKGQTKVIVKKVKGTKEIWIHQDLILEYCNVSEEYLRTKARYRHVNGSPSWRFMEVKGTFYYDRLSIPDQEPSFYRSCLPGINDLINNDHNCENETTSILLPKMKEACAIGYRSWLSGYKGCSSLLALARAAAVLEVICDHFDEMGRKPKLNECRIVANLVNMLEVGYIPTNERRLKEKIDSVLSGMAISDTIRPPRVGNTNAKRIDDPDIVSWIIQMRGMPQNYTNSFIIRKIRSICALSSKPVPSVSWFNNYLATHEVKWVTAPGRFGNKSKHGHIYKGYVPVQNALFAGDCWQIDGTRVNFIPHTQPNGEEKSLYIIAVRDVHSGDVIGVHFDVKEDRWGYVNALKMAVVTTGYLPYELITDRFPGHNTPEWMAIEERIEAMGTKITKSHTATGKAKLERWFSTLQVVFMQNSQYYYGEGVQSRSIYAHRTAEYLNAAKKQAKKEGWDFDSAWKEAIKIIEAYRNTPLSEYSRKFKTVNETPAQLHEQSDKPHVYQVDYLNQVFLFGLEKSVQIRSNGIINTEIMRVPYVYVVNDIKVISKYRQVIFNYDLDDLSKVFIYTKTNSGELIYLCEAVEQRAAEMYGPDVNYSTLAKAKSRNKRIEDHRSELIAAAKEQAGEEFDLLLGGLNEKDKVLSAEEAWLTEHAKDWIDHGQPRIVTKLDIEETDEEDMSDFDIRNMY